MVVFCTLKWFFANTDFQRWSKERDKLTFRQPSILLLMLWRKVINIYWIVYIVVLSTDFFFQKRLMTRTASLPVQIPLWEGLTLPIGNEVHPTASIHKLSEFVVADGILSFGSRYPSRGWMLITCRRHQLLFIHLHVGCSFHIQEWLI